MYTQGSGIYWGSSNFQLSLCHCCACRSSCYFSASLGKWMPCAAALVSPPWLCYRLIRPTIWNTFGFQPLCSALQWNCPSINMKKMLPYFRKQPFLYLCHTDLAYKVTGSNLSHGVSVASGLAWHVSFSALWCATAPLCSPLFSLLPYSRCCLIFLSLSPSPFPEAKSLSLSLPHCSFPRVTSTWAAPKRGSAPLPSSVKTHICI